MTMDAVTLTVVVLTYRRPDELLRALPAIVEQIDGVNAGDGRVTADILVVDNDALASARQAVNDFASPLVRYVVEPLPGIAAARNRGLRETGQSDLLVYIDDDERPLEGWLSSLVATWRQTDAAAVMGRVVSEYVVEPDPWIKAGQFFRRPRRATGTEIRVAAAGNLLLDLGQVRALGVTFDNRFGLSGGEDTLFSRQLSARSGRIIWCDESVATDFVPPERATRSWVLRRARRSGNTSSVIDLYLAGSTSARLRVRMTSVVCGAVRIGGGLTRYLGGLVTRSHWHQARGLRTTYRGVGMMSAAFGTFIQEYARDA